MSIKKPALGSASDPQFGERVKETLEILTAQRKGVAKIASLDTATATTAQIAAKVNEILDRMQQP